MMKWIKNREEGYWELYWNGELTRMLVVPSPFSKGWAIFGNGRLIVDGLKLPKAKQMAKAMV